MWYTDQRSFYNSNIDIAGQANKPKKILYLVDTNNHILYRERSLERASRAPTKLVIIEISNFAESTTILSVLFAYYHIVETSE